jgi:hypothetical protein
VKRETTKKLYIYSLFFVFFFLSLSVVPTNSLMDKKMNVLFDTFPSGSSRFLCIFVILTFSLLRFIFFFLIFWFFSSSSVAG